MLLDGIANKHSTIIVESGVHYPPFRKHCACEKRLTLGIIFPGIARNCRNRFREITLGELYGGDCALLLLLSLSLFSYCFCACFQESICAMAILSLRQNISEDYFWLDGFHEIRIIIAQNHFRRINCAIISERRVNLESLRLPAQNPCLLSMDRICGRYYRHLSQRAFAERPAIDVG